MALPTPKHVAAFSRSEEWTLERVARLSVQEIKQLRENAERLNNATVVAVCSEALRASTPRRAPRAAGTGTRRRTKARQLIARARAFEARGVWLQDQASWSGLRKSDGAVVMALWADAIESADGGCRCLLWAPNVEGSRPCSENPAGKERLEHCKRAIELGRAEGLLVYGESSPDHLPEERANSVHGVDAETVIVFEVEKRGTEFWAKWGRKAAS